MSCVSRKTTIRVRMEEAQTAIRLSKGRTVMGIWKLDNGNEDDDDDKEPCAWPPVWENGFKPPPDSSFMFLR